MSVDHPPPAPPPLPSTRSESPKDLNHDLKDIISGGEAKENVEVGLRAEISTLRDQLESSRSESASQDDRIAKLEKTIAASEPSKLSFRPAVDDDTILGGGMDHEPYRVGDFGKEARNISDLVNIDANGRGHEPSQLNVNGKKTGGQLISRSNMKNIAANASFIRENLPSAESSADSDSKASEKILHDGYRKIGLAVNTRINELTDQGLSDSDAFAQAHDEFWNRVYEPAAKGDEDLLKPPTGPKPPESPDHIEPPEFSDSDADFNAKTSDLDFAITGFAVARVSREKMLSGGAEETQLKLREEELHDMFDSWSDALAEQYIVRIKQITEWGAEADQYSGQASADLADLVALLALPADQRPSSLNSDIQDLQDYLADIADYKLAIDTEKANLQSQFDKERTEKLTDVRTRVDAEMLAEREKKHPKLTKVTNWLKKHPKARLLASVGLAGLGLVGVLTANPPLVGVALAGRVALSSVGAYNAVRSGGEWKVNRDLAKHGKDTDIRDYTGSAIKSSTTRRRNKRGAAAAAVVAGGVTAAIGIHNMTETPLPPKSPVPADYNPNPARMAGIGTERPSGAFDFENLATAPKSSFTAEQIALNAANQNALDLAYNSSKVGMNVAQLDNLNGVIGRISALQLDGGSGGAVSKYIPEIARLVKGGASADKIIAMKGWGPPIIT